MIFSGVAGIHDQNRASTALFLQLTNEYKKLSIFEADEMYDWPDAKKRATKGMMVINGQITMAFDPAIFNIKYAASWCNFGRPSLI